MLLIKKQYIILMGCAILGLLSLFNFPGMGIAEEGLGDCILFSRYTENNWQIWLKEIPTGKEVQVTHSATDKRSPLYIMRDHSIVYRTSNSHIFLLDLNTGEEKRILSKFGFIMDQRLSPDGKKIAFARLRTDLPDDSDVWVSDISGKEARCLTKDSGIQFNPVWSPDSKHIAYVSSSKNQDSGRFIIKIMDVNGKTSRDISKGDKYDLLPCFSPDGEWLVFSSNRTGNYEVWITNIKDRSERQLTHSPGIDTSPVFSSDGKKIVYVSLRGNTTQIWMMDKNGEQDAQLTFGDSSVQDPHWCELGTLTIKHLSSRRK